MLNWKYVLYKKVFWETCLKYFCVQRESIDNESICAENRNQVNFSVIQHLVSGPWSIEKGEVFVAWGIVVPIFLQLNSFTEFLDGHMQNLC